MLYTFRSKAAADVIMFTENAVELLKIAGKEAGAEGIFTPEQIPPALERLRAAIASAAPAAADNDGEEETAARHKVSLRSRAWPLMEMLERAQKKNVPVVWGS